MTETWARQHAEQNPGHSVTESIYLPAWCDTCEAKSPAWGMEKAPTPTFQETLRLVDELAKRYPAPPLPERIDVSRSVLEVLRAKAEEAGVDTSGRDNPLCGIPVREDPTLPPGTWKIVPNRYHKNP